VLRMFQKLNRTNGLTVLLMTHDPEVARMARHTIHIKDSAIADDGRSEAVIAAAHA